MRPNPPSTSGKIHAAKPKTQATGPVFDHNDPLKFSGKGKTTGKFENGVMKQKTGEVFTENSTLIPSMSPSKTGSGKEIGETRGRMNIKTHDTVKDRTASKSGTGEPSGPPYGLKKSYEKSGKNGKVPKSIEW